MQTNNQQDTQLLTRTLQPQNDHCKAIQNARGQGELTAWSITSQILSMHNAHVCYPQEKWPTVCMAIQGRDRLISATK